MFSRSLEAVTDMPTSVGCRRTPVNPYAYVSSYARLDTFGGAGSHSSVRAEKTTETTETTENGSSHVLSVLFSCARPSLVEVNV